MPNQSNFRSDITTQTEPKFFASRIVNLPSEDILFQEIAGGIGYDVFDNIEIHFYEYRTNVLVNTIIVRPADADILKFHITSYEDDTYKTYIRIDFTKLFELKAVSLLPNTYKMVLNFFSDEIGSYENRKLYIQEISPSQTELQLAFIDNNIQQNEKILYEFISKSFNKTFADGVAQKIFKSGVELNNPLEGITYQNVVDNITIPSIGLPPGQTYENTIREVINMGMESLLKDSINKFIVLLYTDISKQIRDKNDIRIQSEELKIMVRRSVLSFIDQLQQAVGNRIVVT